MRVLVTGATGTTGAAVVAELVDNPDLEVRAAVRDPTAYDGPATPVRFDFTDPTTYDAFHGVGAVYLVRPPALGRVERDVFPAVDAMERAGVERVVLLSVLGAERNPLLPHRRLETRLEGSSLLWTFLRAAYFAQNLETTHREEVQRGELFVPAGDGRVGVVDARDVAAVAALALHGGHAGRAYDLTGPEALSFHEMADVLCEHLDHRVTYAEPGLLRFAGRSLREGTPPMQVGVMTGLYTVTRLGLSGRVTDTVEAVLGRPPRTFEQYVADRRAVWTRADAPVPV
jgi:uncharacterized protein YbjT (DUF2867 family)